MSHAEPFQRYPLFRFAKAVLLSSRSLIACGLWGFAAKAQRPNRFADPDPDKIQNRRRRSDKPDPTQSAAAATREKASRRSRNLKQRVEGLVQEPGSTRTSAGSSPTKSSPPSSISRTMRSAISSSRPSGFAATPIPIRLKTSTAKSITRASPTRTSTSPPAAPAGAPTADTSTSRTASRTTSTRIPPAATISAPWKRAAVQTSTYPFEVWHYRYLEGIGDNIDIEFVDTCQCGDYHMTIDRSEKDATQVRPRSRPRPRTKRWAVHQGRPRFKGGGSSRWAPASAWTTSRVQAVRPHLHLRQAAGRAGDQFQAIMESVSSATCKNSPADRRSSSTSAPTTSRSPTTPSSYR